MLAHTILAAATLVSGAIAASIPTKRGDYQKYWSLQGHRGCRGEAIENTLVSFGQAILDGVTT
jgi:hypothetical protein